MENYPTEKPEIEQIPQKEQERPIPPEYIPEPKKHETIPIPEKEENQKESQNFSVENNANLTFSLVH